ncbi:MAG: 2-enoyl thioester reductase domain-containing protein, partial [Verrucomicrobiia bacterium]
GLSDRQAATLKVNPSTAWRMLHDFVNLPPGAWVIQNAGNSAVGRHVIQLAHAKGWRTLSLVRRPELVDELLGIGADAVFLDQDESLDEARSRMGTPSPTLGLNAVGGESATRLMKLLGEKATLVTYGGMSKRPLTIPTGPLIFRDLKISGFWLTRWWRTAERAEKISMLSELALLARAGQLSAPVDRVFPLADIKQAVLRAAEPGRTGKVLLALADIANEPAAA